MGSFGTAAIRPDTSIPADHLDPYLRVTRVSKLAPGLTWICGKQVPGPVGQVLMGSISVDLTCEYLPLLSIYLQMMAIAMHGINESSIQVGEHTEKKCNYCDFPQAFGIKYFLQNTRSLRVPRTVSYGTRRTRVGMFGTSVHSCQCGTDRQGHGCARAAHTRSGEHGFSSRLRLLMKWHIKRTGPASASLLNSCVPEMTVDDGRTSKYAAYNPH